MKRADERSGRDTRLLALVIVVALAVLLLLARFRFPPSNTAPSAPTPGPLDRLTARSTFDDLAAAIANLVQRITPAVIVVQLDAVVEPAKPTPPGRARSDEPLPAPPPRLVPAVRVGQDLALVHVPAGFQITAGQGLVAPIQVVAVDLRRGIALVRAFSVFDMSNALTNSLNQFGGFSYVAVVEAAVGGLTAAPVFIGRAASTPDDQWTSPVLLIGGTPAIPAGALIFALDGRFIGLVLPHPGGGSTVVPTPALEGALLVLGSAKGARP